MESIRCFGISYVLNKYASTSKDKLPAIITSLSFSIPGVGWGGVECRDKVRLRIMIMGGRYFNGADKNKLQKYQSTTVQHCTIQYNPIKYNRISQKTRRSIPFSYILSPGIRLTEALLANFF